ncbi:MAG: GGDEF domain-containing phosphodiesterase [Erysipelotrichaceae bacterium]
MNIAIFILIILCIVLILLLFYASLQYHQSTLPQDLTISKDESNLYNLYTLIKTIPLNDYSFIIFKILHFDAIHELYNEEEEISLLEFIKTKIPCRENEFCEYESNGIFLMFMKGERSSLSKRLKQFQEAIRFYDYYEMEGYEITITIGVYRIEDKDENILHMKQKARIALKQADHKGPNTIKFYSQRMRQMQLKAIELEQSMSYGLKHNQFIVYIQPQINPQTNKVVAGEALIRWHHPVFGILMPDQFIELFEKNGTITKLDCYVLEKVCSFISEYKLLIRIAINISTNSLFKIDMVETYQRIMRMYSINSDQIEIELCEQTMLQPISLVKQKMLELKQNGFHIAIDDFGSGTSTLNKLKEVPFDVLKLDKLFLQNENEKGRMIMSDMIKLCKHLKIECVAEGVEEKQQVIFLMKAGVDRLQGFYYAKAMTLPLFLEYLNKYNK